MTRFKSRRRAFTIVEMLAVVTLIGLLVGLLLPAVQAARESARRTSCSNQLTQIGLAVSAYHSSFRQLPTQLSGTDGNPTVGMDNDRRLSFLVPLLPFISNRPMWEQIHAPMVRQGSVLEDGMIDYSESLEMSREASDQQLSRWVAGGPEPFQSNYPPWQVDLAAFRCPSDPGIGLPASGRTNYAACLGDGMVGANTGAYRDVKGLYVLDPKLAAQIKVSMRGMFVPRQAMRFEDTTDGLSNTLMLGEIATGLSDDDIRTSAVYEPSVQTLRDHPDLGYDGQHIDQQRPNFWVPMTNHTAKTNGMWSRGYRWADGMPLYTAFNTILPPNTATVLTGTSDDGAGVLSASSRHPGGANVCFGDGAVRFVSDSVDAGDRSQPTVYQGGEFESRLESPFGVWGGMGTRAGQELVFADDS